MKLKIVLSLLRLSCETSVSLKENFDRKKVYILAAVDYRNINKQRPDAETIYKYISRIEASNVNKTDIINSIDELVKQNVVVNKKKTIQVMTHLFRTKRSSFTSSTNGIS